jgi:hypothetical protein
MAVEVPPRQSEGRRIPAVGYGPAHGSADIVLDLGD